MRWETPLRAARGMPGDYFVGLVQILTPDTTTYFTPLADGFHALLGEKCARPNPESTGAAGRPGRWHIAPDRRDRPQPEYRSLGPRQHGTANPPSPKRSSGSTKSRHLYGTVTYPAFMPTHVVCPICGKSSSIRSFPAGGGDDIVLQTFQSLGRGKGFSVVSRESGIDDVALGRALKPKLLELVSVFASHGHASANEILAAAGVDRLAATTEITAPVESSVRMLEDELAREKKTREFLEREVTDLQLHLTRTADEGWTAAQRLKAAAQLVARYRDGAGRIVATTRDCVAGLQDLRAQVKGNPRAERLVADHARRLRGIVQVVQEWRGGKHVAIRSHTPR